jgi:Zn-dependent protease
VTDKVTQLSRTVDGGALPSTSSPRSGAGAPRSLAARGAAGATAFGLFVWKFKFLITGALSQGKLLLLGFTKVGTLFTMLLSLGVYWTAFGWKFAAGLIGSMYVHEIGHVAALRRYGIAASAPMFLPGLGAVVRLKQYPATPSEDARVGLAGPLWGLGAAVVAYGVALATGWPSWMAIARMGAWLNLFNLLPVWQLDGGRGFRALARRQRWIATAAIGVAWLATGQGLLMLLLLAAVARSFSREAPTTSDRRALIEYVVLVGVLSALASIEVPQVSGSGP